MSTTKDAATERLARELQSAVTGDPPGALLHAKYLSEAASLLARNADLIKALEEIEAADTYDRQIMEDGALKPKKFTGRLAKIARVAIGKARA